MDRVKIVGIRDVNFTDRDGKEVKGFSFYYTQKENSASLRGESTGKLFVTSDYFSRLPYVPDVGVECFVEYNRYGKVSGFMPAENGHK